MCHRDDLPRTQVSLDRQQLKEQIHALYRRESTRRWGSAGRSSASSGRAEWNLAPTLASGGVVVFPHAGVLDCGHHTAAAVQGCLDSGADRVIVISVLHASARRNR